MDASPLIYPAVAGEFETIDKILEGYSISRSGDGEAKVMSGAGYSREPANRKLTAELLAVFQSPHPKCLIGVPTMDPRGPKYENWLRHEQRFISLMLGVEQYYSAFITRPDSAPWISTREYAEKVQSIWAGKHALVICEESGSMVRTVRRAARKVTHITCRRHEAYARIDKMEEKVLRVAPDVAILCAGPTASCLANRLAAHGIQAVDLGSAGQFLGKLLAS
jgi:hypothetical protein